MNVYRSQMRQSLSAALESAKVRVRLIRSPSLEGYLDAEMKLSGVAGLALESQQLDTFVAAQIEDAVARANGAPEPTHTVPTVYAVSGKGLAEGKMEDQLLLREAVKERLDGAKDVVVALIPVDPTAEGEGVQDPPTRVELVDSAKQFVAELEIPVVESVEALRDFIVTRVSRQMG